MRIDIRSTVSVDSCVICRANLRVLLSERGSVEDELTCRANKKGSVLYTVQKKFQGIFGFTLPLFYGRG